MEIFVDSEKIFYLAPKYTGDVIRDRVEQKKVSLMAGTVGSLLSRPKADDFQLVSVENRLEPFWLVTISARTRYDRNTSYNVSASGPEVRGGAILGQELKPVVSPKGNPTFVLDVVEHCIEERHSSHTFDGLSGAQKDMSKYLNFPKIPVDDLEHFCPEGMLVVPPQVQASVVVRQAMPEVVRTVEKAHIIHEERVDVEAVELYFRPISALEYEWSSKGKRGVIEFDGLTGEISGGGRKLSNQIKGLLNRDLIFDITADAAGLLVPGGSIAVKLAKAAIDRKKSD